MLTVFQLNLLSLTSLLKADRIESPKVIAEIRSLEKSIAQIAEIKSARTNERKAELSTLYGLRATPNPFLCGLKLNIYM